MLRLAHVPLNVINRALDLYNVPRESDVTAAFRALRRAEGSKDVVADFPGISPFGQAIAEYLSLSGPWAEDGGEFAGEGGIEVME